MLNHFRNLSMEASALENNNHSLETEAAEARTALQSARDLIADLRQQLSDKECLIMGYESQVCLYILSIFQHFFCLLFF